MAQRNFSRQLAGAMTARIAGLHVLYSTTQHSEFNHGIKLMDEPVSRMETNTQCSRVEPVQQSTQRLSAVEPRLQSEYSSSPIAMAAQIIERFEQRRGIRVIIGRYSSRIDNNESCSKLEAQRHAIADALKSGLEIGRVGKPATQRASESRQ